MMSKYLFLYAVCEYRHLCDHNVKSSDIFFYFRYVLLIEPHLYIYRYAFFVFHASLSFQPED